jgi:hypothetical protein
MVKCGVLFEVRTEFLNIIDMSLGYKGLSAISWRRVELFVVVKLHVIFVSSLEVSG